ncbi:fibronectin type III domain-containing protein [Nocardiopsis trehalosi]|uniref:fibronectin type III domain-containing protein n=1 Tax=Nocardiopsis trehalosi TaxID=109329 RepID=UPI00082DF431|nr:hypothetical protein [Nocardiopsis trehalosi]
MTADREVPEIPGYRVTGLLRSTGRADLYAARADGSGEAVLVRVLRGASEEGGAPFTVVREEAPDSYAMLVRREGGLTVARVVEIGLAVAAELEPLHEAGLVHNAISPRTLLFRGPSAELAPVRVPALPSGDPFPPVLLDELAHEHLPPEAFRDGRATPHSDVYRLASTLWTLLAGRPPHGGGPGEPVDPDAYREAVLRGGPPPVPRDDVPPALDRVLRTGMDPAPARRPRDAREFGRALSDADRAAAGAEAPPRRAGAGAETPSRRPGTGAAATGIGAAGAATGAGAAEAAAPPASDGARSAAAAPLSTDGTDTPTAGASAAPALSPEPDASAPDTAEPTTAPDAASPVADRAATEPTAAGAAATAPAADGPAAHGPTESTGTAGAAPATGHGPASASEDTDSAAADTARLQWADTADDAEHGPSGPARSEADPTTTAGAPASGPIGTPRPAVEPTDSVDTADVSGATDAGRWTSDGSASAPAVTAGPTGPPRPAADGADAPEDAQDGTTADAAAPARVADDPATGSAAPTGYGPADEAAVDDDRPWWEDAPSNDAHPAAEAPAPQDADAHAQAPAEPAQADTDRPWWEDAPSNDRRTDTDAPAPPDASVRTDAPTEPADADDDRPWWEDAPSNDAPPAAEAPAPQDVDTHAQAPAEPAQADTDRTWEDAPDHDGPATTAVAQFADTDPDPDPDRPWWEASDSGPSSLGAFAPESPEAAWPTAARPSDGAADAAPEERAPAPGDDPAGDAPLSPADEDPDAVDTSVWGADPAATGATAPADRPAGTEPKAADAETGTGAAPYARDGAAVPEDLSVQEGFAASGTAAATDQTSSETTTNPGTPGTPAGSPYADAAEPPAHAAPAAPPESASGSPTGPSAPVHGAQVEPESPADADAAEGAAGSRSPSAGPDPAGPSAPTAAATGGPAATSPYTVPDVPTSSAPARDAHAASAGAGYGTGTPASAPPVRGEPDGSAVPGRVAASGDDVSDTSESRSAFSAAGIVEGADRVPEDTRTLPSGRGSDASGGRAGSVPEGTGVLGPVAAAAPTATDPTGTGGVGRMVLTAVLAASFVIAALGAVALGMAWWTNSGSAGGPGATSSPSPTAPELTAPPPEASENPLWAPEDVRITADSLDTVTLAWTDTTQGRASYYVVGGPVGTTSTTLTQGEMLSTQVEITGLNPSFDYCFTVVAVISVEEVAPSQNVCTNRTSQA